MERRGFIGSLLGLVLLPKLPKRAVPWNGGSLNLSDDGTEIQRIVLSQAEVANRRFARWVDRSIMESR